MQPKQLESAIRNNLDVIRKLRQTLHRRLSKRLYEKQYQRLKQGGVVIHRLLAIYMFGALASVCDDHFVPSLEQITRKPHVGSDVELLV